MKPHEAGATEERNPGGKLANLVFPEEERNKAVMQAQLANLYVEVLQNECIQHDIIKEALVKLLVVVALAENSLGI